MELFLRLHWGDKVIVRQTCTSARIFQEKADCFGEGAGAPLLHSWDQPACPELLREGACQYSLWTRCSPPGEVYLLEVSPTESEEGEGSLGSWGLRNRSRGPHTLSLCCCTLLAEAGRKFNDKLSLDSVLDSLIAEQTLSTGPTSALSHFWPYQVSFHAGDRFSLWVKGLWKPILVSQERNLFNILMLVLYLHFIRLSDYNPKKLWLVVFFCNKK